MRAFTPLLATAILGVVLVAHPTAGQSTTGLMADLVRDIEQVEEKVMGLAEAIPADKYAWRPGEGVRSTGEVFQHIAADNYLLPGLAGVAPPASTNIDPADYSTVQAYESRSAGRDEIIADLRRSFAHLKDAMRATPDSRLGENISMFGQDNTVRGLWVLTATHLHEHLGQMIAYARTNGVVPPWSR